MYNLSSICNLKDRLQAGWTKCTTLNHKTELHINNPSFQWLGQNLSSMKKKNRLFRVKRFKRSEAKPLTRSKFPGFFKTAYTESRSDTCLTSSSRTDTCSLAELNTASQIKWKGKHKLHLCTIWTAPIRLA